MNEVIHSARLDLIPLTPAFLRAVLARDFAQAERVVGLSLPGRLEDMDDVCSLWLQRLETDPAVQPWLARAMGLRERRLMIGHIGFHTPPGAEYLTPFAPGAVEFGFTVYPPFRRQGYAREASLALMRWAHEIHRVTRFVLSIRPDNTPSQGLAAGLGFVRIGSHIDEVDGFEEILEYRLEDVNAILPNAPI